MTTGRQLAERAIREPMQEIGWRPRAAGWFTREIAPGYTGVVAVSAASSGHAQSTADINLHIGLREESVEPIVAQLCAIDDSGYKSRTVNTSIGYLTPEQRWRDSFIDAETATDVCSALARDVDQHAWPYLARLSSDARALLDEARMRRISWPGACRVAVLTRRLVGVTAAEEFLAAVNFTIPPEHQMLSRLRKWMTDTDRP